VRKAGQNPGRGSELYVQPAELARKLIKEMEAHKVSRAGHVSVRNRYTIFLCPEDYDRLGDREGALLHKLEHHLAKHVRAKKYDLPGEISVSMVFDDDLVLGHFGILAERDGSAVEVDGPFERARWTAPPAGGRAEPAPAAGAVRASPARELSAPKQRRALETSTPAARAADSPAPAGRAAGGARAGATEIITPRDAAGMDLAWQTIVLKAGNRERAFTQSRVLVGRSRDVDFRIDDPNVSRRHAAIFWSEGRVMIEDLGSTNGTMVNGYPVSSTVVRAGDVIVIGDCRITVEIR
jgi:hypothetical protein